MSLKFIKVNSNFSLAEKINLLLSASVSVYAVLKIMASFSRKYKVLYFSQEYIARLCGIHRVTVNRIMRFLHEMGLIEKTYRHRRTCFYKLTDMFYNPPKELKAILGVFLFVSVSFLKSANIRPHRFVPFTSGATVYYNNKTRDKNNTQLLSNSLSIYHSNLINGRSTVDFKKEDFIPPIVNKLQEMKLTTDQKLKLAAFPKDALDWAYNQLRFGAKTYSWYKHLLEEYCSNNEIRPNWRTYYQLKDVFGKEEADLVIEDRKEPKKEIKKEVSVKANEGISVLKAMNPLEVFEKQYSEWSGPAHPVLTKEIWWNMGVAQMVRTSFWGFIGQKNLSPDGVLMALKALIESHLFIKIIEKWGPGAAAKFILLCIESAIIGQKEFLQNKYAIKRSPQFHDGLQIDYFMDAATQVDKFMQLEVFKTMCNLIGEEKIRSEIYELLNNWLKLMK